MPDNKILDATLSLFRLAFLDREIWIGKKPDRDRLRPDKKPAMFMSSDRLSLLANDFWDPLALITDNEPEFQAKAFLQFRNIMDLISVQEEKEFIGYIIIDDISYKNNDFVFHWTCYKEI